MFIKKQRNQIYVLISVVLFMVACNKGLPEERYTVGEDSNLSINVFSPTLGRNTVFQDIFFRGSTTYPSTFSIINMRRRSGDEAPEMKDIFPVKVWKDVYTGDETSIEEIEAKRTIAYKPIFEVGRNSGEFTMWKAAKSTFVRTLPDSGYVFDLQVENSGGRRVYKNVKLQPYKELPCEPSTLNQITGQPVFPYVVPNAGVKALGDSTNRFLSRFDVAVYLRKLVTPDNKNTLTIRFLDKNDEFINPDMFNDTKWEDMVHGFNMVKTATGVTYDVAYPIPLVPIRTRYTSLDGSAASIRIRWKRTGFGGSIENDYIGMQFRIFEEGPWELVFRFLYDNPRFD